MQLARNAVNCEGPLAIVA